MKGGSDVGEKPLPMWVRGGEDKYVENCCSNNFARENDTTKFTGKLGPGQGNLLRKRSRNMQKNTTNILSHLVKTSPVFFSFKLRLWVERVMLGSFPVVTN